MRMRTLVASLSLACTGALALAAGSARAEKFTIDDDTFYTIGVLAQPQLTFGEDAAPDGGWNSDFLVRRGRLVLTGQIDSHIGFIFITDQPNWGKNGDYSAQFIIQDAVASYKVGPELTIDAGFMLLPFVRNNYLSAGALNTVDFRTPTIKFPISKAFRDMGVEARGLLADDRIYYRAGIFNGIASRAGNPDAVPPVAELNGSDSPRVTGTVRYNIAGKEDAYAFSGIYFAKDPVISVGVGADFQNEAYGEDSKHLGVNADVFVDYPLDADNEIVASAAFLTYADQGVGGTTGHDSANAFYVEAGYRYDFIEPVVIFEYFKPGADGATTQSTLRAGVNWWITQHKYNLKAELAIPLNDDPVPAGVNDKLAVTIQTQVVF
jgi:hypothetical protein